MNMRGIFRPVGVGGRGGMILPGKSNKHNHNQDLLQRKTKRGEPPRDSRHVCNENRDSG